MANPRSTGSKAAAATGNASAALVARSHRRPRVCTFVRDGIAVTTRGSGGLPAFGTAVLYAEAALVMLGPKAHVPFGERGGRVRGALDFLAGRYPAFLLGGGIGPPLPLVPFP